MNNVKQAWWSLRGELKALALWLLCGMPLGTGVRTRALLMPLFLERMGKGVVIQSGFRIASPEKVSIGSHCNFGQNAFITGGGGVRIGDWVGFGPDVKVWSVNHRFDDPDKPWLEQGWELKPVVIEDDVWLGANAFVMPGVTIGRGAIISAGAIVSKSIPPYALVAGNPGRVVGWRKRPVGSASAAGASDDAAGATTAPSEGARAVDA